MGDQPSVETPSGDDTGRGPSADAARSPIWRWGQHALTALLLAAAVSLVVWYMARPEDDKSVFDVEITASASGPAPKIGNPAPDFELQSLDGSVIKLSDLRGQGVWISFWASWCPPCRAENPDIESIYLKYRDDGLAIVAVNLGENPTTVSGYVERTGLTFPVGLDWTTGVAATYRIVGIPSHYFVDPDGVLRYRRIGALSREQMEEKVQSILPGALDP